ncbi:hypothetical protein OH77DRAFT_621829 [Trametes cingulata]|nr:hypothetical protein OH77DRAFT_621829 [Trametes cingulata]
MPMLPSTGYHCDLSRPTGPGGWSERAEKENCFPTSIGNGGLSTNTHPSCTSPELTAFSVDASPGVKETEHNATDPSIWEFAPLPLPIALTTRRNADSFFPDLGQDVPPFLPLHVGTSSSEVVDPVRPTASPNASCSTQSGMVSNCTTTIVDHPLREVLAGSTRTSAKRRRNDDEEPVAGPSRTRSEVRAVKPATPRHDGGSGAAGAPPTKRFRRTKAQVKALTLDLPPVPCPVPGCRAYLYPTRRNDTGKHLEVHYGDEAFNRTEELACLWGCAKRVRGKLMLSHVCSEHVGKPFLCPKGNCKWRGSRSSDQRQHMKLTHGIPD